MNPKFLKAASPQPLRLCESTALARLGHNERKRIHTKQKFGLIGATQWNPTTGSTYVGVSVSAPRIFSNHSAEWDKYLGECRASLNCVAARESVEIQTCSTDLAFEDGLTSITHHVHTLGEFTGLITNLLQWALAPTRDYELLDILACSQGRRAGRFTS